MKKGHFKLEKWLSLAIFNSISGLLHQPGEETGQN